MGALWDKFKRLKLERDMGAGSKRPFSYSLPEAAVLREGSYRLAAVPCRAMPCHAAAWARWGAVGCSKSAETCVSPPTEERGYE